MIEFTKPKLILMVGFLCSMVMIAIYTSPSVLKAQTAATEDWSTPIVLFEGEGTLYDPTIVADQAGGIHVFWRLKENGESNNYELLYYMEYTDEQWSPPIDIFASSTINGPSAATDPQGYIYLIWQDRQQTLTYSEAQIHEGISASSWKSPISFDSANMHSHLVTDVNGTLHLAYAQPLGNGITYQQSQDYGLTWSNSKVALTSRSNTDANFVRLAVGDNGIIHVVWTEFLLPDGWPPIGTFYTRSTDGGLSWENPQQITGEGYNQINVVTGPNDTVHLLWNGMAGVHGRYHQWSNDNGVSWTDIDTLNTSKEEGSTGPSPMVIDSVGTLHVLIKDNECVLYLSWQPDEWSQKECISQLAIGASDFIEEQDMTISEGNKLHVIFWDNRERLWYMTRETVAPSTPLLPFPTAQPTAPSVPSPTPLSTATSNKKLSNDLTRFSTASQTTVSPTTLVFISIAPVIFLITITVLAFIIYRKR